MLWHKLQLRIVSEKVISHEPKCKLKTLRNTIFQYLQNSICQGMAIEFKNFFFQLLSDLSYDCVMNILFIKWMGSGGGGGGSLNTLQWGHTHGHIVSQLYRFIDLISPETG